MYYFMSGFPIAYVQLSKGEIYFVSLPRLAWHEKNMLLFVSVLLKQIRKNGCTIITPELEGFRRPNWAQIKADNMGGLVFGFDYRMAQKRRSRGLY